MYRVRFFKLVHVIFSIILYFLVFSSQVFATNRFELEFNQLYSAIQVQYEKYSFISRLVDLGLTLSVDDRQRQELIALKRTGEMNYILNTIAPLATKYAWAIPNDDAIEAMREYGPLIEIGAATGYWAFLLQNVGVDIIAYDNFLQPRFVTWFNVLEGDEHKITDHPDRTLFLCWPPKKAVYPLASKSLELYQGRFLIYVGGKRGGATADPDFFDQLDASFEWVKTVNIPQWPGYQDELMVYRRK